MDPILRRIIFIAASIFCVSPAFAQSNAVKEVESKLDKWVETRKIISKERADWMADKEILESQVEVLKQMVESLETEVTQLQELEETNQDQRSDLQVQRAELLRADRTLKERLTSLEEGMLQAVSRLPEVLTSRQGIASLINSLPEEAGQSTASSANRLVTILGVLQQTQRFNGTTTTTSEIRDGASQDTLYWGLSFAFSVNADGTAASFGQPSEASDGWTFAPVDDAEDVRLLLDIAQGNTDQILFVNLPVSIQ